MCEVEVTLALCITALVLQGVQFDIATDAGAFCRVYRWPELNRNVHEPQTVWHVKIWSASGQGPWQTTQGLLKQLALAPMSTEPLSTPFCFCTSSTCGKRDGDAGGLTSGSGF